MLKLSPSRIFRKPRVLHGVFIWTTVWHRASYASSLDTECTKLNVPREKDLCQALASSMEWTWFGHAVLSPGWRMTFRGMRNVYCKQKITSADIPQLEHLRLSKDWRLQVG